VPLTAGTGQPTLFVSACEASADLHGARVMEAVRARAPGMRFVGIGGDRMVAAGLEPVFHARDLSVMGISEVLGRLATIRRAFARARACMAAERPGAALLIDAPDFNLRLARHARELRVPVIDMIPPKVWAWRKSRLKTIARRVDHVLVILPFEPPIYEAAGVPVTYVGNPLVDEMHEAAARAPDGVRWRPADLGLADGRPLVGLLPGSRPGEIAAILRPLLAAGRLLAERLSDVQFAVPVAGSLDLDAIRAEVERSGLDATCIEGRAVELLLAADAVAMASGTVTLQAALAGVPGVIVYRAAPLTYAIGSRLVRVPHFGLTNLVAGRRVVPELLQGQFTPEAVCGLLDELLTQPDVAEAQRKGLGEVRSRMGPPGGAARAAEAVLGILEQAA
jgi:lipid-A-disaccharide synthase